MKSVFISLFMICSCLKMDGQEWYHHFVGKGAKPSIAIDKYNGAHVAYMFEVSQGYLNHWKFEFDFYFEDTLKMGSFYGPLDIKTDSEGNAHIVYHDHVTEDLTHVFFTDFRDFEVQAIPSPGHDGWDGSLFIDTNDHIHTASIDPNTGIEYAFYDGLNWSIEAVGSGALSYSNGTCIALLNDDSPCISYYDDFDQQLKLACKDEDAWSIETADPVMGSGRFSSLGFDKKYNPWISYFRDAGMGKGYVMLATRGDNGWEHLMVDSLKNVMIGRSGGSARNLTDLAIDSSDHLHLSYCDQEALVYAKYDRHLILRDTLVSVEEGGLLLGQQSSIDVTQKGAVYISYYDIEEPVPLSGNVWMITNDLISSTKEVGFNPMIKIWPNPTRKKLFFENEEHIHLDISIYDLHGRLWSTHNTNESYIHLDPDLKPGLYFFSCRKNNLLYCQKFLVH